MIVVNNAIIVDVEATTAIRQAEVLAAIERKRWNASISIKALGRSDYGSAEMLGWLVYEHGISCRSCSTHSIASVAA